jgi:hypothetical protein
MVFVAPDVVTPAQIEKWRGEHFTAIIVLLDEEHSAGADRIAATAVSAAKMESLLLGPDRAE